MPASQELFLALRYLKPKRSLVSVITLLSVLGPALGVAVLIIVTSVFSGFDRQMKERLLGLQPHIAVYPQRTSLIEGGSLIRDPRRIMEKMEAIGSSAAPGISDIILLQREDYIDIRSMQGIDPRLEPNVTDLKENLLAGSSAIQPGQALVGDVLARAYNVGIGDQLLMHSPRRLTGHVAWKEDGTVTFEEPDEVYLPEEVTVAGIFDFGVYDIDANLVYVHIDQAADVIGAEWGVATAVRGRVDTPFDMTHQAGWLQRALPQYAVVTWQEENQRLFGALQVEKTLTTFLLFFIVLVAGFCIAGTLITSVIQKTREIGVLKAVGLAPRTIAGIFLMQGFIIGLVGTAVGTAAGLLVVRFRNAVADFIGYLIGHPLFPPELYHLEKIPAWLTGSDIVIIVSAAFGICLLAAVIPAVYASCLSPAAALREE